MYNTRHSAHQTLTADARLSLHSCSPPSRSARPPALGCQSSLVNKARNDAGMTDIGGKMFGNLTCSLALSPNGFNGRKKEAEERHKSQSRMPLEVYMLCFLSGSGCLFCGHCLTQFPRFADPIGEECSEKIPRWRRSNVFSLQRARMLIKIVRSSP